MTSSHAFRNSLAKAVASIQNNPFKTQIQYGNIRVFYLQGFPYGIHFQVDKEAGSVLILAFFHHAEDSEKWKRRAEDLDVT